MFFPEIKNNVQYKASFYFFDWRVIRPIERISTQSRIDPIDNRSARPACEVVIEIAPNAPRTMAMINIIILRCAYLVHCGLWRSCNPKAAMAINAEKAMMPANTLCMVPVNVAGESRG